MVDFKALVSRILAYFVEVFKYFKIIPEDANIEL